MANQTLRELAKAHAQGTLDKDSYRKSRAELIQGIITQEIPLQEIDFPPLVQPPEPESLDDTQRRDDPKRTPVEKTEPEAATSPDPAPDISSIDNVDDNAGKSNKFLLPGIALVIIAILIVGVLALTGNDGAQDKEVSSSPSSSDGSAADEEILETITKAEALIQGFLDKKNWSSSSLDNFLQQWAELATDDILAAKDNLALGQLTNAIYKQLLEEQALSGLVDDDSSLIKQRQLVEFATQLGIEDKRISLPDELDTIAEPMEDAMEEMQP